jgi:hypothetical protein
MGSSWSNGRLNEKIDGSDNNILQEVKKIIVLSRGGLAFRPQESLHMNSRKKQ